MKKKLLMLALGLCLVGGCITGCGSSSSESIKESTKETSTPVQEEQTVETTEETTTEPTVETTEEPITEPTEEEKEDIKDLPDGFVPMTLEEMKAINDFEPFSRELAKGLEELGIEVDDIEFTEYGNFEDDSDSFMISQGLDVYIVINDGHKLLADLYNIQMDSDDEPFVTMTIRNAENNHAYYKTEGLKDVIDMYDYDTDELISEHTKDKDDIMSEYKEEMDRITNDTKQEFEEIAEKYK